MFDSRPWHFLHFSDAECPIELVELPDNLLHKLPTYPRPHHLDTHLSLLKQIISLAGSYSRISFGPRERIPLSIAKAAVEDHASWLQTSILHTRTKGTPYSKPATMSEKEYTYADVSAHSSKKDLFVVIHDKVYNASSFVDEHPYVEPNRFAGTRPHLHPGFTRGACAATCVE
jgi:hypothetical protein